jgi:hypothetical protein
MFDELDRLRQVTAMQELLRRYQELARPDRQVWQDRITELDGLERGELVRLHGEMIAYGWLEQNTGSTPSLRPNAAPACYRITTAGIRALATLVEEEVGQPSP